MRVAIKVRRSSVVKFTVSGTAGGLTFLLPFGRDIYPPFGDCHAGNSASLYPKVVRVLNAL